MHVFLSLLLLSAYLCINHARLLKASKMRDESCRENEIKCVSFHQKSTEPVCLPNHKQCDKKIDCNDGSDEDPKICQFVNGTLYTVPNLGGRLRATGGEDECGWRFLSFDPKLLIVVDSEAGRPERRRAIRRHFGAHADYAWGSVRVVFFVGKPRDRALFKRLRAETDEHGDVVLTNAWQPYTRDSPFRTVRAVSALKWARANCGKAQYVLKTGDTVDISVSAVMKLVRGSRYMKNSVWTFDAIPQPKHASRNCWSQTPYMMTKDAVKKLYFGAFKKIPYEENDVDFLTKVVATNENIFRHRYTSWKIFRVNNNVC